MCEKQKLSEDKTLVFIPTPCLFFSVPAYGERWSNTLPQLHDNCCLLVYFRPVLSAKWYFATSHDIRFRYVWMWWLYGIYLPMTGEKRWRTTTEIICKMRYHNVTIVVQFNSAYGHKLRVRHRLQPVVSSNSLKTLSLSPQAGIELSLCSLEKT